MSMLAALGISALMLFTGLFSSLASDDCRVIWSSSSGSAFAGAGVSPSQAGAGFAAIKSDGHRLIDAQGKPVTLRGFITITHDGNGNPVEYTRADYQRMRDMGANYQSIRLGAGLLGACAGDGPDPAYLEQLDRMVVFAAEAGIYTQFKMTVYDIEGVTELRRVPFWQSFWRDRNGEQEQLIDAWRVVWERYRGNPAVIGYDLLNEPERAGITSTHEEFQREYMTPFYRKTIDELRTADSQKLAFIQPAFGTSSYSDPIRRDGVVYAPHFYPNIVQYYFNEDFSTRGYRSMMSQFVRDAAVHNAPLFIGEFGMPWDSANDGDVTKEEAYRGLETAAVDLFDSYGVGFSRPWFSDDRAGTVAFGLPMNWAVIKGTNGLSGEERRFITDVIARPYPQRVAGDVHGFGYHQELRWFRMDYTPASNMGTTEIFIPRDRHFPNGFDVIIDNGLVLRTNPLSHGGLRTIRNTTGNRQVNIQWDRERQVLVIEEWRSGDPVTLLIRPR
jgi:endoglycosylceramidase